MQIVGIAWPVLKSTEWISEENFFSCSPFCDVLRLGLCLGLSSLGGISDWYVIFFLVKYLYLCKIVGIA